MRNNKAKIELDKAKIDESIIKGLTGLRKYYKRNTTT